MANPGEWGRVAEDGTVFLRTADGERAVGSWQAGDAEAGLAHYARRYDDLHTRAKLLRDRAAARTVPVAEALKSAEEIRATLPTAAVVGDLGAVSALLDEVGAICAQRKLEEAHERNVAQHKVDELVAEAEKLAAESTDWKGGGDRLRAITDEVKSLTGERTPKSVERKLGAARSTFGRRRSEAFAEREQARAQAKERKEQLIREAEGLRESTEWGDTAKRYRSLMDRWKAAGHAGRADEEQLWQRFRAAQDHFFSRRSEAFSKLDAERAENQKKKEALLERAEALDPAADLAGATAVLRQIQDEWESIGKVPREVMHSLEDRLSAVEDRIRDAADAKRATVAPVNPMVESLRRSVAELEDKVARAKARGDAKSAARAEQELGTKRLLLEQAESAVATR